MSRNQFRILVVLNQLLILATVVVQEMFEQSLPTELRSDQGTDVSVMNPEPITAVTYNLLQSWYGTAILVLGLTAAIGLFFGQRWGRPVFLLSCLGWLSFGFTSEIYLSNGWSSSVGYLAAITDGAILGLAYFSHVKRMFEKPKDDY